MQIADGVDTESAETPVNHLKAKHLDDFPSARNYKQAKTPVIDSLPMIKNPLRLLRAKLKRGRDSSDKIGAAEKRDTFMGYSTSSND
jgi:hypothetical protein